MRGIEFARPLAVLAPSGDEVSILGKLHDAVIGPNSMPIGNVNISIGCHDDGADRAQEFLPIAGHARLAQNHQNVARVTKLNEIGALAVPRNLIAGPDVTVAVHVQAVRNRELVRTDSGFESPGGTEFDERRDFRICAFLRSATLENPDALAVTVINLDLDGLTQCAPSQSGPVT